MVLGGHFLLLMLPAHLLLMMQRTHLLLVMLSGHLLLMMLSIHLLLMIHRLLPMSRAFVLDSFVVGPGLVSLNVVLVSVKIFCLVFVPVILGSSFWPCSSPPIPAPWRDVQLRFPSVSQLFPLPRPEGYVHLRSPVCFQLRSRCSPCGLESLRAFALARAFVLVE